MSLQPIRTGQRVRRASYSSMGGNWQFERKRKIPSKKKIIFGAFLIFVLVSILTGPVPIPVPVYAANYNSFSHTRTSIFNQTSSMTTQYNFNSTCVSYDSPATRWRFNYQDGSTGSGGNNCNSANILELKAPVNFQTVTQKQLEIFQAWQTFPSSLSFDSYAFSNRDGDDTFAVGSSGGQCFNAGFSGTLKEAKLALRATLPITGVGKARIFATSGTYGTTCIPTGSALAESDSFDMSTLTGSYQFLTFSFSGANRIALTSGTKFALQFKWDSGTGGPALLGTDVSASTHGGNNFFGFTPNSSVDTVFEVNSLGPSTTFINLILRTNGTLPAFGENWNPLNDRNVRLVWRICPGGTNPSLCGANGFHEIIVTHDVTKSINDETVETDRIMKQDLSSSSTNPFRTWFQAVLNFTGSENQLTKADVTGTTTTTSKIVASNFQQAIDYFLFIKPEADTTIVPIANGFFDWFLNEGPLSGQRSFGMWSVPAICDDPVNVAVSPCNVAAPTGYGPPSLSDLDLFDPRTWVNALIKGLLYLFVTVIPAGFVVSTLATLELLKAGFNTIGNFFGWGSIGDSLATFLASMGALLTGGLATITGWITPFVNRALDFITFVNTLFNSIMNSVLDFLTLVKTVSSMIVTVFSYFVFVGPVAFMTIDFVFYFVFVAQDGLSGFAMWFRWNKWAAFAFLNLASRMANVMISMIGWLISRVPTLSGTHLPKFPHIESGEIPSFKMDFGIPSIRRGDATSVVLLVAGFTVFVIWLGSTSGPFSVEIQGRITPVQNIFQPIITISMLLLVFILPAELIQRLTGTVKQRF